MPRHKLEDAKPRLLAAGLSLFAKLGIERVNSNSIARRAKLAIGTFYSHFEDKYALLQEIQARSLAILAEWRLAAVREADSDVEAQVSAAIAAAVEFARAHPAAYRVAFGRERAASNRSRPVISESHRPTVAVLGRLQRTGQLDPDLNLDLASRAYAAAEVGLLLWWLEDPTRSEARELVETLTRLHPAIASRFR
jgi:AcrR family transcriptional regulator